MGLEPISPRMSRVVTNYTNGGAGRLFILPAVFIFIPAQLIGGIDRESEYNCCKDYHKS